MCCYIIYGGTGENASLAYLKSWIHFSALRHTATPEVVVGGLEIQGHPWLYFKFESHLGYMRPCPKKKSLRSLYATSEMEIWFIEMCFVVGTLVITFKFYFIDQPKREQVKIKSSCLFGNGRVLLYIVPELRKLWQSHKFAASLGYIARCCLKKKKINTKSKLHVLLYLDLWRWQPEPFCRWKRFWELDVLCQLCALPQGAEPGCSPASRADILWELQGDPPEPGAACVVWKVLWEISGNSHEPTGHWARQAAVWALWGWVSSIQWESASVRTELFP